MRLIVVSNKRYNLDQNYYHVIRMHGKFHGYRRWAGWPLSKWVWRMGN